MRNDFEHDHGEMIAIAEAILALLQRPDAEIVRELNRLRQALSASVATHCAEEAALLARRSFAGRDAEAIVRRYYDELLAWRAALTACNSAWPVSHVVGARTAFAAAFRPIVAALRERVRWEEDVFYPAMLPDLLKRA
jgi:hypothetical protein